MAAERAHAAHRKRAPEDDATLVRRCARGEEDAWAALVDKYKNLIYSVPIKYGLSPEDAGDIFQSVCTDLIAELPRLREPKALPAWLIRVAANKSIQSKAQSRRFAPEDETGELPDPSHRRGEAIVAEAEQEQMVRTAMLELKPRCRELVKMLFLETPPRPYSHIAQELGIAVGSIGFIRGRCLAKLRKTLEKLGFR
jgi:RNA polymerase sigma factor (sigma-70 family)